MNNHRDKTPKRDKSLRNYIKSRKIKATKLPTGRYDYVEKKANQGFNS